MELRVSQRFKLAIRQMENAQFSMLNDAKADCDWLRLFPEEKYP